MRKPRELVEGHLPRRYPPQSLRQRLTNVGTMDRAAVDGFVYSCRAIERLEAETMAGEETGLYQTTRRRSQVNYSPLHWQPRQSCLSWVARGPLLRPVIR